ncbi:hypothetical protein Tsubulata_028389 [Turnera subulata]|uniref:Uncharacterized protein n=1 Tax=Turnera subulata TaxID=218843 RepID=A0A9Q0FX08_9ROSI|nr:hypothetical protein Tsubulata_028389 [Turnera subulata]
MGWRAWWYKDVLPLATLIVVECSQVGLSTIYKAASLKGSTLMQLELSPSSSLSSSFFAVTGHRCFLHLSSLFFSESAFLVYLGMYDDQGFDFCIG